MFLHMKAGAEQLRDWMRRRGLNQAETARVLGVHFTFVSLMLSGDRTPSLDNAIVIERETGIPVEAWSSSITVDRSPVQPATEQ